MSWDFRALGAPHPSYANIAPNRGVVIEELDDNYGAIVPLGGKCKQ
ncbi:unnamed protein product [Prunus armeniaca]